MKMHEQYASFESISLYGVVPACLNCHTHKCRRKDSSIMLILLVFLQGDKNIIKFEGDHNSPRPQFYYDSISIFFHNVLHPPDDLIEEHASESMYEYLDGLENLDENVWHDIMSAQGFTPNSTVTAPHQRIGILKAVFLLQVAEFSADSTEDAINHSRSKWQMSRTELLSRSWFFQQSQMWFINCIPVSRRQKREEIMEKRSKEESVGMSWCFLSNYDSFVIVAAISWHVQTFCTY
eukprot:Gb_02150 [translate_table: standard]